MQMVPNLRFTKPFWEREPILPRLPLLKREDMSRRDPCRRPADHIHGNEYVSSRRASDVFPLKPVLHKRAYSLSNYQINTDVSNKEHREAFYSYLPRLTDVRKADAQEQLTGRRKTRDLDSEQQKQMSSEKLSKEIHSQEMMLQQKIGKAGETLRRIQRERTSRHERNERYPDKERLEKRLYSDGYGPWDDERDRYENERERKRNEREKESRRQPLTSEMAKLKDKRQCGRKIEMLRETQDNTWHRRERRNVEEVNKIQKEKYDRRREDEERERGGSSDSRRTERSHVKQERFTKESPYEPASGVGVRRRRRSAEESEPDRTTNLRAEEDPHAPERLMTCGVCQRHFLPDRLETHVRICKKKQPQRKIFDMSKHRAKGTDLEEFMKTNSRRKTPEEVKKSTWRQKHEVFTQITRQGRAHETPSALHLNPEYLSCPHCGRTFAPGPAERHIPKCQNIRSRPAPPKQLHNRKNTTR